MMYCIATKGGTVGKGIGPEPQGVNCKPVGSKFKLLVAVELIPAKF